MANFSFSGFFLRRDGSNTPTTDLDLGTHKITNLQDPTANQDAATKFYVDNASGGISGPVSSTDNAIVRWDGTGGTTVQNSVNTIADTSGALTLGGASSANILWTTASAGSIGDRTVQTNNPLDLSCNSRVTVVGAANSYALAANTADIGTGSQAWGVLLKDSVIKLRWANQVVVEGVGLIWSVDNTADIGITLANRPANIYLGGSVRSGLGAVGSAAYSFDGDIDTGLYQPAASPNVLAFTTAATNRGQISALGAWTIGTSGGTATHTVIGTNLTVAPGASSSAFIQLNPSGSANTAQVRAQVVAAADTGSTPVQRFTVQRDTPGVITTRPLWQWNNFGDEHGIVTAAGAWSIGFANVNNAHLFNGNQLSLIPNSAGGAATFRATPFGSTNRNIHLTEIAAGDDTGSTACVAFTARRSTPAVVSTRPLFTWENHTTTVGSIAAAGMWTIGPSTGLTTAHLIQSSATTSVSDTSATENLQISNPGGDCMVALGAAGTRSAWVGANGGNSGILYFFTRDSSTTKKLTGQTDSTGKWTIGPAASNVTHRLNSNTTAAGTAVLTLTNGPGTVSRNPAVYLTININGTDYVVPAFTTT